MTDVIVDYLNKNTLLTQNITWASTNQLVGKRLEIGLNMLEIVENYDTKPNLNLTTVSNEILCEKNPHCLNLLMKEKQCKICAEIVFYRIKTLCCKEFVCFNCLIDDKIKNGKCLNCRKYCNYFIIICSCQF